MATIGGMPSSSSRVPKVKRSTLVIGSTPIVAMPRPIAADKRPGMGDLPPKHSITKEGTRIYRASKRDCNGCALKPRCCPNTPTRKIPRDLDEDARDVARALANTPAYERSRHRRKKVEMLFAHLKCILRLGRLRLRGPCGARDEFLLTATAQNLRKLAQLQPMTALT